MALPAGVTQLGTFKGAKGDTGSLAFATAETIPWTEDPTVTMVGPAAARGAHFQIPLPLPGPETVNNDEATALLIQNPTATQSALSARIADAMPVAGPTPARIPDGTTEWWIGPIATALTQPYPRIVSAAYGEDGSMLATETTADGSRTVVVREPVGWTVDDHDAPALWARDGHRPIMMWTRHGNYKGIWLVVGDREASIDSLAAAPILELDTIADPHASNYVQIFRIDHLSTDEVDYFWAFTRRGDRWQVVKFTIDQATGAYTFIARHTIATAGGLQVYMTVSEAHDTDQQRFRAAFSSNPDSAQDGIWYLEIDPVTGTVTSPLDGSVNYTIGTDDTGVAVYASGAVAVTQLIPDSGSTSVSRRLFYTRPGPASPAVAWAEWSTATPDAATYKITEWDGSAWVTTDLGAAGPRFGYVATSNYLAGMWFTDPCPGRDVYLCRTHTRTLERAFIDREGDFAFEVLATGPEGSKLIRPHSPVGLSSASSVRVTELSQYSAGAFTFQGDVVSRGQVTAPASLIAPGVLVHVDMASTERPVFGIPSAIPNLAAVHAAAAAGWGGDYDLTVEDTISPTTGLVERSAKGGLHVAVKQGGSVAGEMFALAMSGPLVDFLDANPTDDYYVGVVGMVTRKRVLSGSDVFPWVGLTSVESPGGHPWAITYPAAASGNIASAPSTSERIGNQNAIVTVGNPFLADLAVQTRNSAWGTRTLSDLVMQAGNVLPTATDLAQSSITYIIHVENLTKSGRSYATVNGLMAAQVARFTGDTYTAPA